MQQTRHVDWEQIGDLTAYLVHLAERTRGFEMATDEDRETADRLHNDLLQQSLNYLDEDDGSSLAPEYEGKPTPYTLDAADWAFLERWFTDAERMGAWAMDQIGEPVDSPSTQTRVMEWSSEGELINELHWLSEGAEDIIQPDGASRPMTPDEVAGARHAFDTLLAQEHDEPELGETDDEEPTFAVTLPTEMWALIDRLCVGVDFGWGVGVVGMTQEVAR